MTQNVTYRDVVNGLLARFGEQVGVEFEPVDEAGYTSLRHGDTLLGLNVLEDQGALVLLAPLGQAPTVGRLELFVQLLELNLAATGEAAFAYDPEQELICLRACRGLDRLDLEGFIDLLETLAELAENVGRSAVSAAALGPTVTG